MIIAIDVGNTMTVLGLLDGTKVNVSWRVTTDERTCDEYSLLVSSLISRAGVDKSSVERAGISCVVPSQTAPLARAIRSDFGADVSLVDWRLESGVVVDTDNPMEVGGDRIANAVGAYYEYGGPVIVVDMGTATTYDYVTSGGEYKGGLIAPGMASGARELWESARMLPEVELCKPAGVIGRTTIEAMRSGIIYGAVAQIEGIIRRMWENVGFECRVVLTGGHCELVKEELPFEAVFDPELTLKGIAYAVEPALRRRTGR
jgi:type III pantothenate kinase